MIEFKEDEPYCRMNGVLMSPENYMDLFGVEWQVEENLDGTIIICGNTVYTDKPISEIVLFLGEVRDNGLTVSLPICDIELLDSIKPLKQFKEDYPNFNREKYDAFYDELDKYYEDMRNKIMEEDD